MKRSNKYTKELLEPLVRDSTCVADVIRKLGLKPVGGNFYHIAALIRYFDLVTTHFTGSAWAKGKTRDTDSRLDAQAKKVAVPDAEVFVEHSRPIGGAKLKRRLLRLGWEYRCAECGLTEWRQKPIALHLDHINGNRNDNRFMNLRFLCPNCHQQTETWGNKCRAKEGIRTLTPVTAQDP